LFTSSKSSYLSRRIEALAGVGFDRAVLPSRLGSLTEPALLFKLVSGLLGAFDPALFDF